jgi:CRISPR-associated endoribonuclease Cas6
VTFDLLSCRLRLAARRRICFLPGQAGNNLRGALGHVLRGEDYARIFRPVAAANGPSGLADSPRPFVIRASELDGRIAEAGEQFCFGLNWFDAGERLDAVVQAFGRWADLIAVEQSSVSIQLTAKHVASRIRVEFQTPTDPRSEDGAFGVLLARARDRVSTLRGLYGGGPLDIDFRGLAERANCIETTRCELTRVGIERRSSRTGQRHGIGGFTGFVEYEGDLTEFVPYLEAAHWTGVGRHCSWGNGQIATSVLNSDF